MQTLLQDLRYGARMLLQRPGFTLIAVVTLALGIGANTAIFSVINAVLLKPLPYREPQQLITARSNQSVLDLDDLRAWSQSFTSVAGSNRRPLDYTGGGEPVQVSAGLVTGGYFATLGVNAALGRTLNESDDKAGGARVVVPGHEFWQQQFSGNRNVIGQALQLSGNSYTVVGVMPTGFKAPRDNAALWLPIRVGDPQGAAYRGVHYLHTYFRLKPGVTLTQAAAEMQLLDERLAAAYPAENRNRRTVLLPLRERIVGEARTALWVLFGAVGLVLLIACANFANLLLALVVKQGARLALLGTALGLAGALVLTRWLKTLLFGVSVTDPATFVLIALLLLAVALLACWIPARRATKVDPLVALRCD
ncbi:MAG: ABC transporter permease [Blastocatellia bacterium]